SFKVRRRVVERQMSIFADADEGYVNRRRADLFANALANLIRMAFPIPQVIISQSPPFDQTFEQVFAKARRMSDRQTDVLIEVDHLDFRPVNAGRFRQGAQKLELRRAGRGDDARARSLGDRADDGVSGLSGRSFAQLDFVAEDLYYHDSLTLNY